VKKVRILAIPLLLVLVLMVGMGVGACGGGVEEEAAPPSGDEEEGAPPEDIEMEITSVAFQEGGTIPTQYTCDGQNKSPALSWSGVPEGTQSFALILYDSDAPAGTFTHWVIFNIPADTLELAAAISTTSQLPSGALQGRNDFGSIGYSGPCPPPGASHHYHFVVYALDLTLDLSAGASKAQVLSAMQGHILAQAELIGLY
jgi:Raf kinase inhibitor-like YbhB/YbcL family protein